MTDGIPMQMCDWCQTPSWRLFKVRNRDMTINSVCYQCFDGNGGPPEPEGVARLNEFLRDNVFPRIVE